MISFVCASCGHKVKVADQFAGKNGRCPKCKQVVQIPLMAPLDESPANESRPLLPATVEAPWWNEREPTAPPASRLPVPHMSLPVEIVHTSAPVEAQKQCPFCSEWIMAAAKKCRFCGETLDAAMRVAEEARRTADQVSSSRSAPTVQQSVVVNVAGSEPIRWSPGVAALLSFFLPGMGQLYKGQPINGMVWFVIVAIGYVLLIVPGLFLHACCVIGAASGDPRR